MWGEELCPAYNESALQKYKIKGVGTGRDGELGSLRQFSLSTHYIHARRHGHRKGRAEQDLGLALGELIN